MRDGVAHATDWWAIVFNPSMPYRLVHMLLASGLTVAFLIAGISAFRRLIGDRSPGVRLTLKTGVWMAAGLIPLQILAGDLHGLNTLEHQPQKVAAMEGNWETGPSVPLILFAIPDEEARANRWEVGDPLWRQPGPDPSLHGEVPGLNDFVTEDGTVLHPPVAPVFWSFRVMVATGMLMLAVSWIAAVALWRRPGVDGVNPWLLRGLVAMTFSGWLATLAGWYTTEIGRQPWLVHGVVTTAEAVADVPAPMVLGTLIVYLAIYAALIALYVGVIFHLARKAAKGETAPDPRRPATLVPAE
jgi:cytochrome bd ubiquinol oxidase subunit I